MTFIHPIGHGAWSHWLPAIDGPRKPLIYEDGCRFDPLPDGEWQYTPAPTEDDPSQPTTEDPT